MKTEIRNQAKVIRSKFNAICAKDWCVQMVIKNLRPILSGSCVGGYYPKGDEFDLRPIMKYLQESGFETCLPCVDPQSPEMQFRLWAQNEELQKGPFDLNQPANDNEIRIPDVLLIPLLAADKQGNRIGYGKGHYDFTIAKLKRIKPVLLIGVCYDVQLIDRAPREETDQVLDYIVTEKGLYRCQK